jgi:hypothetical protein
VLCCSRAHCGRSRATRRGAVCLRESAARQHWQPTAGFDGTPVASGSSAVSPRPGRVRLFRRALGRGRDPPQTHAVTSRTWRGAKRATQTGRYRSALPRGNDARNATTRFGWMPQPRGSVPCGGDILHAAATSRPCRRRPAAVRLFGVLGHVPDASGCPSEPFVQTQDNITSAGAEIASSQPGRTLTVVSCAPFASCCTRLTVRGSVRT